MHVILKRKRKSRFSFFVLCHVTKTLFLVTAHEFQHTKPQHTKILIPFFVCYNEWPKVFFDPGSGSGVFVIRNRGLRILMMLVSFDSISSRGM